MCFTLFCLHIYIYIYIYTKQYQNGIVHYCCRPNGNVVFEGRLGKGVGFPSHPPAVLPLGHRAEEQNTGEISSDLIGSNGQTDLPTPRRIA